MYLLGIGDQGNGRAIISFGNPDTARHVSSYVPGLGTNLDKDFAKGTVDRAQQTAIGAQKYDPSSASIVWLGYDAPLLEERVTVSSPADAEAGAPAYNRFMDGIRATNQNADPHITAIGHSYGSLTVGTAAQQPGGIPGADDIVLLGSPGVGADHAGELGVGQDHVYVGASDNDPVSMAPSFGEAAGGAIGRWIAGAPGAVWGAELGDIGDDDNWYGTDPASEAFGGRRFVVADGPRPLVDELGMNAHANYFNPQKDPESADNIARVVAGLGHTVSPEQHR
jgi:hypothetical protein